MSDFGKQKRKCKEIREIDMFNKDITLYYKGKDQTSTTFGSILTIIYTTVYLVFFIYKIIRMFRKTDLSIYTSEVVSENPPSIQLSNEIYYLAFALEDPETEEFVFDETIYTAKAFFKRAVRENNEDEWLWDIKEIELEQCKLEKFGTKFQEKFSQKLLDTLYCFKDMNFLLEGTESYDTYSIFSIQIYPCVNTTENNNHCKTAEEMDYILDGTYITLYMENNELSSDTFYESVKPRIESVYTPVGKSMLQDFQIFLQLVNIETDLDYFGFNEFENKKIEKYVRYDDDYTMSSDIINNIYKTGEYFVDVTIQLTVHILIQQKTYAKLLDILGNVGGIMEFIFSLFKLISTIPSSMLFDISLVNSLFEFDITAKKIYIHNKYKEKIKKRESIISGLSQPIKTEDKKLDCQTNLPNIEPLKYSDKKNANVKSMFLKKKNFRLNRSYKMNNNSNGVSKGSRRNLNMNFGSDIGINQLTKNKNEEINFNDVFNNNIKYAPFCKKEIVYSPSEISSNVYNNVKNDKNQLDEKKDNNFIIDKIKLGKCWIYVLFICNNKRNNINNILLEEAMKIITENLDIINMFKKIYKSDEMEKLEIIQMSDNCKSQLRELPGIKL